MCFFLNFSDKKDSLTENEEEWGSGEIGQGELAFELYLAGVGIKRSKTRLHKIYRAVFNPRNSPTNQENWPNVGTIASTLSQYSAIYGNTLGQFSWFVGMYIV